MEVWTAGELEKIESYREEEDPADLTDDVIEDGNNTWAARLREDKNRPEKRYVCFSLDSILLADFVRVKGQNERVIDLGCGNAPIPLFLTMKTTGKIFGVELQEEVYRLAEKSVKINHFEKQITIINNNIKNIYKIVGANIFDVVISNPHILNICLRAI